MSGGKKIVRSESEWRQLFDRYSSSGLTQEAFCKRESVALSSFQKWHHKLSVKSPVKFTELPTAAKPVSSGLELEFPSGVVLRVRV